MSIRSSGLLLSHPTGNANVRAAATAFEQVGWLRQFNSCICWNNKTPVARMLPPAVRQQLQRRSFPLIPTSVQRSHPWRELARLVLPQIQHLRRHEHGPLSIDAVYRSFDRHVATQVLKLDDLKAVYAYEDAALHTFTTAKRRGVHTLYDLPIGYWRAARQIFEEERQLNPEWACTLTGLNDSPTKLARKDHELQLSDLVIVPSQFVRSTLLTNSACSVPIVVVPFGSPAPLLSAKPARSTGALRVLYVGSLGQRKGISYLLDAIHQLGAAVQLTLIGKPVSKQCRPLADALQQHRWLPSIPHGAVLHEMRQHDVLVLPSLFEGYALVISEAISQGLPVIATPNSGATESIRNGVEGFIVPVRDSDAIVGALQQLIDNPELLSVLSSASLCRAAELSWASYQSRLVDVVAPFMSS